MSKQKQIPVSVSLTLLRVEKLPSRAVSSGSKVRVLWERGSDKEKGSFSSVDYQRGIGEWFDDNTTNLSCTMIYKSSNSFKRKKITFKVETFHPLQEKSKKTIGKAVLNLSDHISSSGNCNTSCILPLQNRYNAGTISIEIISKSSETNENNNDISSDNSDDMQTDLGDIDDDFVDRIIPTNVAINTDRLLGSNSSFKNTSEVKKSLEISKNKEKHLQDQINKLKKDINKHQHKMEEKIKKKSPRNKKDDISILLNNIHEYENKLVDLDKTIENQDKIIENNKENKDKQDKQDNINLITNDSSINVEIMMTKLQIEDLKQDIEYISYVIEEYTKTLTPQKGKKATIVDIFEQQLRFMKQDLQRYKTQYEEYTEYIEELNDDIESYTDRLESSEDSNINMNISLDYKDRVYFLRKEFLCENGHYDSSTHEPVAALKVIDYITNNKCEEEWIMEVLLITRFLATNSKNDLQAISYWFSVALYLTHYLENINIYKFKGNIKKTGIIDDSMVENVESITLEQSTNILNYELYYLLCQQIFPQIDDLIEVSFFSPLALILDSSRTLIDPSRSVEGLIQLLTRFVRRMKEASIYPIVVKQLFHQLIYYISTSLANRLLLNADLCSPTVALSIKMGLSFIQAWIQETSINEPQYVEHCQDHLSYILDVVGILLTVAYQREPYQSSDKLKETFPSVSPIQVHKLVTSYNPDKYISESVPDDVIRSVKSIVLEIPSKEREQIEITFPLLLSLSNIKTIDFNITNSENEEEDNEEDNNSSDSYTF